MISDKIEQLIEEVMVKAIVKTPENEKDFQDPEGRLADLKNRLSTASPEQAKDILDRYAFQRISEMQPYRGVELPEKDKQLAWEANQLLTLKDPKEIQNKFAGLKKTLNVL